MACDGKSHGGAHLGLVLGGACRLRGGELGAVNRGWPLRGSGPPRMWLDPTPGPGEAPPPRQSSGQQRLCSLVLPKAAASAWMAPTAPIPRLHLAIGSWYLLGLAPLPVQRICFLTAVVKIEISKTSRKAPKCLEIKLQTSKQTFG